MVELGLTTNDGHIGIKEKVFVDIYLLVTAE
jgi:hypothetical protein